MSRMQEWLDEMREEIDKLTAERDAALEALRARKAECRVGWVFTPLPFELNANEMELLQDWALYLSSVALGEETEPFTGDADAARALVERVRDVEGPGA